MWFYNKFLKINWLNYFPVAMRIFIYIVSQCSFSREKFFVIKNYEKVFTILNVSKLFK